MKSCNSKSISPGLSRVLPSEVEVLESIYLDELQVVKGNGINYFGFCTLNQKYRKSHKGPFHS